MKLSFLPELYDFFGNKIESFKVGDIRKYSGESFLKNKAFIILQGIFTKMEGGKHAVCARLSRFTKSFETFSHFLQQSQN